MSPPNTSAPACILATEADGAPAHCAHAAAGAPAAGQTTCDAAIAALYDEVGRLARDLHDSMGTFVPQSATDTGAVAAARHDLTEVLAMTERAANRTMDAVEDALVPLQSLARQLDDLGQRDRDAVAAGQLDAMRGQARHVEDALSSILMAQDYQDLSGQIIQRTVRLLHDVEHRLLDIVVRTRETVPWVVPVAAAATAAPSPIRAEGPITDPTRTDVARGQDDVDDLLSSLGF